MASSEGLPVAGIRLSAVSAGIKVPGRLDVVLMEIAANSSVAAVFTRNAFCAAPVQLARTHLRQAQPGYLLVNTGNANAGTGSAGLAAASFCCQALADAAGVASATILPFSTGVIGEPLPAEKIAAVMPQSLQELAADNWLPAAEGILTTDTRPKISSRQLRLGEQVITVTGMAKGAGMLRPNMATMLAYLATDASVAQPVLQSLWHTAVESSFNRITVDGDTSTNDAALLVATGAGTAERIDNDAHPHYPALLEAVQEVALELAQGLVRDGEGASKFVTVTVSSGSSTQECLEVAYTIAHSPLVKTALFASDPNWGRLLAAIGRADVAGLDVDKVAVLLNGVLIAEKGCRAASYTEEQGVAAMAPADVEIEIQLNRGAAQASIWTSDLSYDYVRINAEYRT